MKKKICMIAYTNYPSDARVRREAETLAATGKYEVFFLALKQSDTAKPYQLENVKVIELNVPKYRGQNKFRHLHLYLKFLFLAFCECNRLMLKRQINVIHVHNMPNFLVFAGLFARLFRKPMILDIHDTIPETYFVRYGDRGNRLLFKLLCWEESLCCKFVSKIICVNHVQRDALVERGIPSEKIVISMNVPDPKWFGMNGTPKNGRRNKNLKLIYHGTIAKRLGIDLAIRAFAKVCRTNKDVAFHIIGNGENFEECSELCALFDINQSVHLSGKMLPLESLLNALKDMDIGIVANRKNAATELMLPVKMLEYIALNIPVIVPRLKAIEYYFTEDMVTYFEPDDVDSMARAILNLFNDGLKREAQAENAKTFLENYGWEKHKMNLINLYQDLIP